MHSIKRLSFTFSMALIFIVFGSVKAQTPRINSINITAESDKVHIAAQGDVSEMRVEVANEAGDAIFESGAITGNTLDWKMRDAQGERVAAGTYLITVTFRTATGKLRKRVEQVTVDEVEEADTRRSLAPEAMQATITGAGLGGRIAKFTGATTIGNSVITESAGKVGIGTAAPNTTLTVIGAISNNGAISAGNNAAGGIGVKGSSASASGIGVLGTHTATSGTSPAVKGETNSTSGGAVAVQGIVKPFNSGNMSVGVWGINQGLGFNGYGVKGSHSGAGTGVYGTASDGGTGVAGTGGSAGVGGFSESGSGMIGTSNSGIGVEGYSGSNYGVSGYSSSSRGVYGNSANGYGVQGNSTGGTGVVGSSNGAEPTGSGRTGVYGVTSGTGNNGVWGYGRGDATGVAGTSETGYAGYFEGDVRVTGTINPTSDRAAKTGLRLVNGREILRHLVEMPIQTWSYRSDRLAARHVGPTAQDFAAAFGLGRDDKTIATVDADGVALAAIQGLYQQNQELAQEVRTLRTELQQLKRTVKQQKKGRR